MTAITDHDPFCEPQAAPLVTNAVDIDPACEQVGMTVSHNADHKERRFGGNAVRPGRAQHRQADDMAVALALVDVGAPQRGDPVAQHRLRVGVDYPGAVATLAVVRRGNLVE